MSEKDDKTRLSDGTGNTPPQDNERTRVAGQPSAPDDATRFAPVEDERTRLAPDATAPRTGSFSSAAPSTTGTSTGQKSVLKNRFMLEDILGVGGMGVVYKAKDRNKIEAQDKNPYVAIKLLGEDFKTHPEAFIALQRESRKTMQLTHPNIVRVFDFDKDEDQFFMTMEYMEGRPLDKMIKQYSATGLPIDDVWQIVRGLCEALSYAHAEKVIHADFKPGNIFVTNQGEAKVFDFGIARAVTNVDRHDGKSIDKTVFDAGSLGALTPAYASYEMLVGQPPDPRDDLYALGCITYEMLTGKHPFNKVPADEAKKKGLKAKRIPGISKQQWRAIEKSLAFGREERLIGVKEFQRQLFSKRKPRYIALVSTLLIASAAAGFYYTEMMKPQQVVTNTVNEEDIRNKLELQVRVDLFKENIGKRLAVPEFSDSWQEGLWTDFNEVSQLLPAEDGWLGATQDKIYTLHIEQIDTLQRKGRLHEALDLIDNSYRYSADAAPLDERRGEIDAAIKAYEARMAKEKATAEAQRVQQEKRAEQKQAAAKEAQRKVDEYNLALANVDKQLLCNKRLNLREFGVAIKKLRELDNKRYAKAEKRIVNELATCIDQQGKSFPEHAADAKKLALRLFKNAEVLQAVTIVPRDACNSSIAGLGGRGQRATCRDKLKNGLEGPLLVVAPTGRNIRSFAISKYEVSHDEFNQYCSASGRCEALNSMSGELPATGRSMSDVKGYLRWLSSESGKRYRLPTQIEWAYAAKGKRQSHDPNRNCQFSSRGIQKGDGLVSVAVGKQNDWGLVNYLGNAQEWVYDKSGRLSAAGGAYSDAMADCQVATIRSHGGAADSITGFRVIRELTAN